MPNGLFAFIEQEGQILVHDIENDAKIAFTYLKNEAQQAWSWLQAEARSPQVQSFLAAALADAEKAAAALVSNYGAALQPVIQAGVQDAETVVANLLNSALGGNVKQNLTIPAAQDGVAQLGNAASLIASQAFGQVVTKLLAAS